MADEKTATGITVQIVTPVGEVYNEPNVDLAIVNTQGGQIGVMKKHVPLLAALTIDELIIKKTTVSPKGDVYVHRDFVSKIVDIYIYKE